jgi:hypothetical protein
MKESINSRRDAVTQRVARNNYLLGLCAFAALREMPLFFSGLFHTFCRKGTIANAGHPTMSLKCRDIP